jgi:voltage-dependent calcium channel alpha-2/delta-4
LNFTLTVLPHDYGSTWIKVGKEIQRNNYTKVNISDFFVGENWKVHPEWVYCKYHYLEGHEFNSSEAELRVFLKKIVDPSWKWSEQYEADNDTRKSKLNLYFSNQSMNSS